MKAIYNYKTEKYEMLKEIENHLTTKSKYGDELIIGVRNIRLNGLKIPDADCIKVYSNVVTVGTHRVNDVTDGKTGEHIGKAHYIDPIVELWETTDGMRLHDLRFEKEIGTTGKYQVYHYILE